MTMTIDFASSFGPARRADVERRAAIGAYLEALLSRFGLSAAALSDGFGLVIGRGNADGVALGTLGERCARGVAGEDEFEQTTGGADLYVHALSVAGRTVYLATLGARVRGLRHVADELSALVS
jgi:hypothetical protein